MHTTTETTEPHPDGGPPVGGGATDDDGSVPDGGAPSRSGSVSRGDAASRSGSVSSGGAATDGDAASRGGAAAGHPAHAPADPGWRERLGSWVTSAPVQRLVIALIVVNAVTLGLETSTIVMNGVGGVVRAIDTFCLAVFVLEIGAKLIAFGPRFFRDGWNVFDLLVVGVALVPGSGPLSVLRSLRVLRVLRLVSALPRLRFIVEALMHSLPGIGAIAALLGIVFYVSAVMATSLFGTDFPEFFGSLGDSLFTLFQIMTLESWAAGIVRPVMETQPWAWTFFVVFILVSAFTMLNLFIAVIVDTMQTLDIEGVSRGKPDDDAVPDEPSIADVLAELRALRAQVDGLEERDRTPSDR